MDAELSPEFIRDYLQLMAGISIDLNEAARLVPYVRGARFALERLNRFDVRLVRPSSSFDPTFPYE